LSLIKLKRFKNKGLAVASFSLCLAVLISIAGCSAGEVIPEEETIIEENIETRRNRNTRKQRKHIRP